MGEHLPYKQEVTGSSPVSSIDADMAELADAQDLGSCVFMAWRFESSYPHYEESVNDFSLALFMLMKIKMIFLLFNIDAD